jgi:CheY-like chemotaxis protein
VRESDLHVIDENTSTPLASAEPNCVRVLYVEDDGESREVLIEVLLDLGFEVVAAATVAEALARLDADRFDVVLADMTLPDADGTVIVEAARRLATPVVVLSGWGDEIARGAADAVLRKPVPFRDLGATLQRVVRG